MAGEIVCEPRAVRVADDDHVAVALEALSRGERIDIAGTTIELIDDVPRGHKFAVRAIGEGDSVRRYRAAIGAATRAIRVGEHVHTHNVRTRLSGELTYRFGGRARDDVASHRSARMFRGYLRDDGRVGTRNEIWIVPTVGCVGRLGERLARAGERFVGGAVEGIHAFNHPFGCSQLGADLDGTAAILAGLANNPNAGGVLVLGLGCESNKLDELLRRIAPREPDRLRVVHAQQSADEFAEGLAALEQLAATLANDRRTEVPLSALRLGVKCGGSDAMSGLTANPLIGRMADAVTEAGGAAILTEIPEMFGAEGLLLERARDERVFDALSELVNRFKRYFIDNGESVSENPSPGNIQGGITTLEEKSLGAVQKGGVATVCDVIDYGAPATQAGLTVLEAPGNDAVSTTALAAAGATLTLFSTGRGTPLGSPVPTMKIASNATLAASKPGWIDFDAARALSIGMEAAADELLDRVIAIASGERAKNEANDERSIGIWKRGVTL